MSSLGLALAVPAQEDVLVELHRCHAEIKASGICRSVAEGSAIIVAQRYSNGSGNCRVPYRTQGGGNCYAQTNNSDVLNTDHLISDLKDCTWDGLFSTRLPTQFLADIGNSN